MCALLFGRKGLAQTAENGNVSNLPACSDFHNISPVRCYGHSTDERGNRFTGDFYYGELDGSVEASFANGNHYSGTYKEGKRSGSGKYTFSNGNSYVGDFAEGFREGQGTYRFITGVIVVGRFVKNRAYGASVYDAKGNIIRANAYGVINDDGTGGSDGPAIEKADPVGLGRSNEQKASYTAYTSNIDPVAYVLLPLVVIFTLLFVFGKRKGDSLPKVNDSSRSQASTKNSSMPIERKSSTFEAQEQEALSASSEPREISSPTFGAERSRTSTKNLSMPLPQTSTKPSLGEEEVTNSFSNQAQIASPASGKKDEVPSRLKKARGPKRKSLLARLKASYTRNRIGARLNEYASTSPEAAKKAKYIRIGLISTVVLSLLYQVEQFFRGPDVSCSSADGEGIVIQAARNYFEETQLVDIQKSQFKLASIRTVYHDKYKTECEARFEYSYSLSEIGSDPSFKIGTQITFGEPGVWQTRNVTYRLQLTDEGRLYGTVAGIKAQ